MKFTLIYPSMKGRKILNTDALLHLLKTPNDSRGIDILRQITRFGDEPVPEPYHSKIPWLIFSGAYRQKQGEEYLDSYNGLVLVEVNKLNSWEQAEQIKRQVSVLPQVVLAFVGLSGRSVKFLVRFSLSDGTLPKVDAAILNFHAAASRMALDFFSMQLASFVTVRSESPRFGCRMSLDPNPVYNPHATAIVIDPKDTVSSAPKWVPTPEEKELSDDIILSGRSYIQKLALEFAACVKETVSKVEGDRFENGDQLRFQYLTVLAQNCCKAGIEEERAVHKTLWHYHFGPYEQEIRQIFRAAYEVSGLFGSKCMISKKQTLTLILDSFLERRYEFRFNTLNCCTEFRSRSMPYGKFDLIDERRLNSIIRSAHREGLEAWDRDVRRFVNSADVPEYNPIDHYLENLPRWDGKDHIRLLADTVPVEDKETWNENFYTWFLGMVAGWKQLCKQHANSTLPLLIGEQACGKSTFCKRILPAELQEFYTDSIDFSKKQEAMLCLTRFLLINIDEFDSVSVSYQSFLKHVVQKPVVNIRKPFEQATKMNRRYSSFIATCNNEDILSDTTGSRRYLCTRITGKVDNQYKINYAQLYAQASEALARGEKYWFDEAHAKQTTKSNEDFNIQPVEEQLFPVYFKKPDETSVNPKWLSAAEIYLYIRKMSKMNLGNKGLSAFGRYLRSINLSTNRTTQGTKCQVEFLDDNN
ncbi:MAG: VapE domain-containing protein [Bacteroidales bacterium]